MLTFDTKNPPVITDKHADFAREIAEIADKYGMDQFEMIYRPKYCTDPMDGSAWGEMRIYYRSIDGRGRPCRNLNICIKSELKRDVIKNTESCS